MYTADCARCNGDGEIHGPQGEHWTCPWCKGSGLGAERKKHLSDDLELDESEEQEHD